MSALEQLKAHQLRTKLAIQQAEQEASRRKRDELERIQKIEQLARSIEADLPQPVSRGTSSTKSKSNASKSSSGSSKNTSKGPGNTVESENKPKRRVALSFEELQAAAAAKRAAAEELKRKEQEELQNAKSRPVSKQSKSNGPSLFIPKKVSLKSSARHTDSIRMSKKELASAILADTKDTSSLVPLQKTKRDLQGVGDILEQRSRQKSPNSVKRHPPPEQDWRALLRETTGYDPSKFNRRDSDSEDMEASADLIVAEERRARKIAIREDQEADLMTEQMEQQERKRRRH